MSLSQSTMCGRLSSLGYKQDEVHHLIDTISQWRRNNGDEWVIKRLKSIKQHLINEVAGKPSTLPWVALHPDGTLKGAFRVVHKELRKGTPKSIAKALNAVQAYTVFTSSEVTPTQWKKFQESAEQPSADQPKYSKFETKVLFPSLGKSNSLAERIRSYLRRAPKTHTPVPATLDHLVLSEERNAPFYDSQSRTLKTIVETDIEGWLPSSADTPIVRKLMSLSDTSACFDGIRGDVEHIVSRLSPFRFEKSDPRNVPSFVGRVSFIQEPGFKLRAVANPNRIIQTALLPLQSKLMNVLSTIHQDCTHNQEEGLRQVQKWLGDGSTVHSVDLSDATNNFPLMLQTVVLRHVFRDIPEYDPYIKLFHAASVGPWRVKDPSLDYSEREFRWTKGQPLGLGPSFPAFALSHHMVIQACFNYQRDRNISEGADYRILGDDIIIKGDNLARLYRSALKSMSCPVSEDKSISSDEMAEFAGKLVLKEGAIVPMYKWREPSDRNFLDLAAMLGPQSMGLFRPRQKKVLKAIAEIPQDHGGLGWNPRGLSYGDRVTANWDIIRRLESSDAVWVPMSTQNQHVHLWRTKKQVDATFGGPGLGRAGMPGGRASAAERPVLRDGPSPTRKSRILDTTGVKSETFDTKSETVPRNFKAVARDGDPRGPTTLDVVERKLKSSSKPTGKEVDKTSEDSLYKRMKDSQSVGESQLKIPEGSNPDKSESEISQDVSPDQPSDDGFSM